MALVAVAIWGGLICWSARGEPSRRVQSILLLGVALAVALATAQQILTDPSYGTDSLAFGQYSAKLVLAGINPFTHSLAPSLAAYHVPVIFTTHYMDGRSILTASYPAGSFLFYLPALALGWSTGAAVGIDVAFWVLALVLLWALLPATVRWLAALVLASTIYTSYVVGGVTDSLYLPFLIVALWRWDRYGDPTEPSSARWIGPMALGVALSVKQTPWFVLPFLLIGVAIEARRRGHDWLLLTVRYLTLTAVVFLALNGPWIAEDPAAWARGVLVPLTSSFVPLGQGLINLTLIQHIGGGNLSYYTLAGVSALFLALLLESLYFDRFKRAWMFLLIGTFFFTPRSLGNYFLMLFPGALVAALTVRATSNGPGRAGQGATPKVHYLRQALIGCAVLGLVLGVGLAARSSPPLSLRIVSFGTNGEQGGVTTAVVRVHNRTGSTLRPYFTIEDNGYVTNFWSPAGSSPASGTVALPPHRTADITLLAPDNASMPGVQQPFQVFAYTTSPNESVSSSPVEMPTTQMVYLTPEAIDQPVPLGKPLRFTAELEDSLGRAIHQAGAVIYLSQTIYTQQGLLEGDASIDGYYHGVSPIPALTNRDGEAVFTVEGRHAGSDPTYFQAWIAPPTSGEPALGYSDVVVVRFARM
jgi:hypothetical protein